MAASISQIIRCIITLILAFGAGNASGSEEEGEEPSHKEALYVKFHPDFIVNLRADRPRFLMVTIQGMSRGKRRHRSGPAPHAGYPSCPPDVT